MIIISSITNFVFAFILLKLYEKIERIENTVKKIPTIDKWNLE
jgi:hypothetical protein